MKASVSCVFLLIAVTLMARAQAPTLDKDKSSRATIVYDDLASDVTQSAADPEQLWISTADLKRATRFEVKPQGVCREELCFPLPKARKEDFVRRQESVDWFNLTSFAQLVHQPVAHEASMRVWYFGLRADQQQKLSSLEAPDFTLPDIHGKAHSLSDFRGKKVLLLTWASW
jgi:AhpC/TSA family